MRREAQSSAATLKTRCARFFVPVSIFVTLAAVIGGQAVTRPGRAILEEDSTNYVRLYEGARLSDVPAPYRYRVAVPWAASVMPRPPAVLVPDEALRGDRTVLFRFALINVLGLTLAATFLFQTLRLLGRELFEALAGGLLFLASLYPLTLGSLPLADAWGYATLCGCLWALMSARWLALAALFTLGVFVKETILVVPIAAWLLQDDWKTRRRWLLALAPAVVAYAVFRFAIFPAEQAVFSSASTRQFVYDTFVSGIRLPGIIKGLMTFGVLWLFAARGWWVLRDDRDHPLVRWAPLVPLILILPFVLALNVGRVWVYTFPIVIPLSVVGIRSVWRSGQAQDREQPSNSRSHNSRIRNA